MSQVITARLSRVDAQPWGFRLQGGKDFGTPLVIQKVSTHYIDKLSSVQHSRMHRLLSWQFIGVHYNYSKRYDRPRSRENESNIATIYSFKASTWMSNKQMIQRIAVGWKAFLIMKFMIRKRQRMSVTSFFNREKLFSRYSAREKSFPSTCRFKHNYLVIISNCYFYGGIWSVNLFTTPKGLMWNLRLTKIFIPESMLKVKNPYLLWETIKKRNLKLHKD